MIEMEAVTLTILAFNIWGLPVLISKNKSQRIPAIGAALSKIKADVICLQEVWINHDYQLLKEALKNNFKYSHYFFSGVVGSGLCIFSKWPIIETIYHQWPLNGYIHMVHHGDWFGGKGVGLAVIDVEGLRVNVYTAHLHAQYHDDDAYLAHRVGQALDTGLFIRLTAPSADVSFLAGDLNAEPGSLCERLLRLTARMKDSYPGEDHHDPWTNLSPRNSFSSKPTEGIRIDYILYRVDKRSSINRLSYFFPLEDRVPDEDFSYSDHEAIAAKFGVSKERLYTLEDEPEKSEYLNTIREAYNVCSSSLKQITVNSSFYRALSVTLLFVIVSAPFLLDSPILHSTSYYFVLIVTITFMIYFFLMSTLWTRIEYNGMMGAVNRLSVLLPVNEDKKL